MSRESLVHIFFNYVGECRCYSYIIVLHSIFHHLHMIWSGIYVFSDGAHCMERRIYNFSLTYLALFHYCQRRRM